MAQSTSRRASTAAKPARSRHAASQRNRDKSRTRVTETADLGEDVLESVEKAQRAAIQAVKTFVDSIDDKVPSVAADGRRKDIVDAALDMADRLVMTQYDFLRKVVHRTGEAVSGRENENENESAKE